MIYIQSNDPNNYGTVEFRASIAAKDKTIKYRVSSLLTYANFSITTNDDYLIVKVDGHSYNIPFLEQGYFYDKQLRDQLTTIGLTYITNDKGLLYFSSSKPFSIEDASHRVKVVLGLYHSKLPLEAKNENETYVLEFPSNPYRCYGNVLYLTARTDSMAITNARGIEETQSICFKTHEILYNGFPIVSLGHGPWYTVKASALQQMKFTLCDFMLEPIILHSPLYLTIEYKEDEIANEIIDQTVERRQLKKAGLDNGLILKRRMVSNGALDGSGNGGNGGRGNSGEQPAPDSTSPAPEPITIVQAPIPEEPPNQLVDYNAPAPTPTPLVIDNGPVPEQQPNQLVDPSAPVPHEEVKIDEQTVKNQLVEVKKLVDTKIPYTEEVRKILHKIVKFVDDLPDDWYPPSEIVLSKDQPFTTRQLMNYLKDISRDYTQYAKEVWGEVSSFAKEALEQIDVAIQDGIEAIRPVVHELKKVSDKVDDKVNKSLPGFVRWFLEHKGDKGVPMYLQLLGWGTLAILALGWALPNAVREYYAEQ